MKRVFDLGELEWRLTGYVPDEWRMDQSGESGAKSIPEIPAVPAHIPGSVQKALLDAGLLPDWNKGLNARLCEWVENRHWIYEVTIPDEWFRKGSSFRLRCLGLDFCGCIRLNGEELLRFHNTYIPHVVDISPHLAGTNNRLQIIFECPPRWLGQFTFTSQIRDKKTRFNYFWDWTCRLVQVGIWDKIFIEATDGAEIESLKTVSEVNPDKKTGRLQITGVVHGSAACNIRMELTDGTTVVRNQEIALSEFSKQGLVWDDLCVRLWWPNGLGEQPLYSLTVRMFDVDGREIDRWEQRIGFMHIDWKKCAGAAEESDPWICVANGCPFFLQGVNWTPIRPNFADVTESDYRKRLELYRDLGFNLMRVWGGGFLEKECFYRICDELGILVWQEFPLSSSGGGDSYPPDDEESITELSEIARSYISRRQHHVCLIIWCGGNELRAGKSGNTPVNLTHPLIKQLHDIVCETDPTRRFLTSTPSGPRFSADKAEFGKGVHWAVNGPWKPEGRLEHNWLPYWQGDDALIRTETGAPGPSPADLIRTYKGNCEETPGTSENPLWRRTPWWIEWPQFVEEHGREPKNLEEYVAWGQKRQARALRIAAQACKARFPRCGGFIIWMGHDSFPCTANTAILDFHGAPKPAAAALAEIFKTPVDDLKQRQVNVPFNKSPRKKK